MSYNNKAFYKYHPSVNFLFFSVVLLFTMFNNHPISLLISLITSIIYSISLSGYKKVLKSMYYLIPIMLFTSILNPIFNHQGVTILTYLPSGNPLTLESILFGFMSSIMLVSTIVWFQSFNIIMTSDKFVYLLKNFIPSLSLILSMSLKFIPQFKKQIKIVASSQKTLGNDISSTNVLNRIKNGLLVLSIVVMWSLENAIDTADSKKSRGYGLKNRTFYSIYKLTANDKKALVYMISLISYLLIGNYFKVNYFRYYPSIKMANINVFTISYWLVFILLCNFPIYVDRKEEKLWKLSQLTI